MKQLIIQTPSGTKNKNNNYRANNDIHIQNGLTYNEQSFAQFEFPILANIVWIFEGSVEL